MQWKDFADFFQALELGTLKLSDTSSRLSCVFVAFEKDRHWFLGFLFLFDEKVLVQLLQFGVA